jgi:ribosomal-protein-alanine N-acetyltransferase
METDQIIITDASPRDVKDIHRIELESFRAPFSQNFILKTISNKRHASFAARLGDINGKIVGYISLLFAVDEVQIINLATDATFRRRGVAAKLLHHAIDVFREKGYRSVILEVRPSNHAALLLYEKFGFAKIGIRPEYYADNREDAIVMGCEI